MYLKNNKGVTLSALTITIIVMLILSSIIISVTNNRLDVIKISKLSEDIDKLSRKIDEYYLKYGEVPTLATYCNKDTFTNILTTNASNNNAIFDDNNTKVNPNDGDEYLVIDLEKLDGVTLNYGYDTDTNSDYQKVKSNSNSVNTSEIKDIYVINKKSHQIYYPKGIESNGIFYYTYQMNKYTVN